VTDFELFRSSWVISCYDERLDINPQLECAETLASRYYTDQPTTTLGYWQSKGQSAKPQGTREPQ
jgi:hypothetical protein